MRVLPVAYRGTRAPDGTARVEIQQVEGEAWFPLELRADLRLLCQDTNAVDWGFTGATTMQLALGLAASRLEDEDALEIHRALTGQLVAFLPEAGWTLDGALLAEFLKTLAAGEPVDLLRRQIMKDCQLTAAISPPVEQDDPDKARADAMLLLHRELSDLEGASFRGWQQTPVEEDGCFLIYRLVDGKMAAAIFPLLLVSGGEGSLYRWTAGEDLAFSGEEDNLLSAKRAAHEAMTRAAEIPALPPRSTRIQVFNAEDVETARKLALSVAVCQEVALLFDAIDRDGLTAVDLSEWSRLRAVGEAWWIECGWGSAHLDAWLADLEGQELAPGVLAVTRQAPSAPSTSPSATAATEEEQPS